MADLSENIVNILLVDDRPDGLMALEAVLKSPDYNLIKASSGESALRHFLRDDFAVVLLDVQMPGLDGFETAKLMRQSQGTNKTPIIFVTAINFEDRYVHEGYETGAVDYIFKPFDPIILKSKVSVFVNSYRMTAELKKNTELLREAERRDRERLLAELELENLRRYQNLADAIPSIVWKTKPTGTLDYVNKAWIDYTGLSLDQSSGHGWQTMIHPDDLPKIKAEMGTDRYLNVADSFQSEYRIRRASDGLYRWHIIKGVPETNLDGSIISWIGTSTDIHDRKLAEEERVHLLTLEKEARREAELAVQKREEIELELIRAKEEAEEANKAKSQLLANISHEIRTPLGVVLGFSELLIDDTLSKEERAKAVRTIIRNGQQLARLIDDVLDMSKVEAGLIEIEKIPFSLKQMMSELTSELEHKAKEKDLQVKVIVDKEVPEYVSSDPTRLRQILTNITGNAFKFTEKGQVTLHVTIMDKTKLIFSIEDSGIGIPANKRGRLFQDFMQADSSMTRRYGGTGLGLSLSRRLARQLGGDLVLSDSFVNKGSCFKLFIEIEIMQEQDVHSFRKTKDHQKGGNIFNQYRLDGLKIFLVEDALDNQLLISSILKQVGAELQIAGDGEEGVEKILQNHFDLVLMDLQMPKLDGYQATKKLRNLGFKKPILALTAHAMKDVYEECMKAGFNDRLTKPIDFKQLLSQIQKHASVSNSH